VINTHRESAYVDWYLLEKEYELTNNVRNALNTLYYYMRKKGYDKSDAVYKTFNYYKYKKGVILEPEFLWKQYNVRQAHIKNAKVKFKEWEIEKRKIQSGIELPFCACGCGERVTKKGNKYIHGHHRRCLTQEQKNENARYMREVRSLKNRKDNVIYYNTKSYKNL